MAVTNLPVAFQFAGLPAEYCIESAQRFALDIAAGLSGYVPGTYSFINFGNTEPAPADRDKPWVRLNGDGTLDRIYVYAGGFWGSRNLRTPDGERIWWAKAENLLWSYDGGDGSDPSSVVPTPNTGAMWQRDADYDARFPLQMGVLPSGLAVNPGDTGGEEKHALVEAENALHGHKLFHSVLNIAARPNANEYVAVAGDGSADPGYSYDLSKSAGNAVADVGKSSDSGAGTAHQNMPPYRVGLWAKRTGRTMYVP